MPRAPDALVIRRAEPRDVGLVLELVRELAEYERLAHVVLADEALIREALFAGAPDAHAAFAEVGGETAGLALWFYNFSTFVGRRGLYLEDLFVRPRFRGQGVGVALLRWLAREAQARGCGRMEWAVLDWNESAIDFYRALGAKPMDEWTVYRLESEGIAALAGGAAE